MAEKDQTHSVIPVRNDLVLPPGVSYERIVDEAETPITEPTEGQLTPDQKVIAVHTYLNLDTGVGGVMLVVGKEKSTLNAETARALGSWLTEAAYDSDNERTYWAMLKSYGEWKQENGQSVDTKKMMKEFREERESMRVEFHVGDGEPDGS